MVTYGFKRNKLFRRFSFYQSRQESLNQNPSGHNPVQGQKQHELICLNCIIKRVSGIKFHFITPSQGIFL